LALAVLAAALRLELLEPTAAIQFLARSLQMVVVTAVMVAQLRQPETAILVAQVVVAEVILLAVLEAQVTRHQLAPARETLAVTELERRHTAVAVVAVLEHQEQMPQALPLVMVAQAPHPQSVGRQ
jgi:hypothetical protein